MKILYFDTETTGIDPAIHEITQFAAIVEIDGEVRKEISWRCRPTRWEDIAPSALETTGISIEQLKTFNPPQVMAPNIRRLFDKHINRFDRNDKFNPAGHNVGFDLEFLQAFWKQHIDEYGTGSYQSWRALDSRVFASFLQALGLPDLTDVKLGSLCARISASRSTPTTP